MVLSQWLSFHIPDQNDILWLYSSLYSMLKSVSMTKYLGIESCETHGNSQDSLVALPVSSSPLYPNLARNIILRVSTF